MPTQEEKKTLNIFDATVFDAFTKLVETNGYTQYRAVEGALRAFMVMPRDVQVALMANTDDNIIDLLQRPIPLPGDQIENLWTQMGKIAEKVGVKINKPKRMTAEESKKIWAKHKNP